MTGTPFFLRLLGAQRAGARDRQRQHRPAFRRAAEFKAAHLLRIRLLEARAQVDHFVVAAGALEAGAFGDGGQGR
jgi:hypothetical protein